MRRGDASSCSYAAPGSRKKNQSQGASTPDDMQNRIDRLEGLVLSLMTNGANSAGPAAATAAINRSQSDSAGSYASPLGLENEDDMIKEEQDDGDNSEVEGVTNSLGHLKVDSDKGKSLYIGDSHWHTVLADVSSFDQKPFRLCCRTPSISLCGQSEHFSSPFHEGIALTIRCLLPVVRQRVYLEWITNL